MKRTTMERLFRIIAMLVPLACATSCLGQDIVAHRGASYDAPENTLAAFNEAWRQGADGIEGDFYVTSDKKIVCIHDKDTKRTSGKNLDVASSTLQQLRQLEYGSWKDPNFKAEVIPTFEEVLSIVPPGKLFVIELKTGPEIVPLLRDELVRLVADQSQLLIISFDDSTISKCKDLLPDVRAHWLTGYKLDSKTKTWHPTAKEVAAKVRECHADGLGTQGNREVVDSDFVASISGGGVKEFHVWTVDDVDDAKYFQALGAVGITTNRPSLIAEALAQEAK